jgi:transposase
MRPGISLSVTPADVDRLRALVKDRNAPQKHVWRAQIVMLSAEGLGTNAIMRETGKSKTCVWRWQERFAAEGVDGLLHDKTRPSRIAKLDPSLAERVVALTMEAPASEETHWTGATMAKAAGRGQHLLGPAHLARARAPAASRPTVQTVQRPALHRQIARRRRALCRSARTRHCPVGRQKEPDSGP